jgi:glycosyltransferase involved in cell wall biosynthesis
LIDDCRIPREQVGLVYHGIDAPRESDAIPPPALAGAAIQFAASPALPKASESLRHSIRPLVFTAGSIRPARGLEDLVRALAHLGDLRPLLLVAGQPDPRMGRYAARLKRLAMSLGVADSIRWLGPLSARQMSWCYFHASALVMTSRVEACPNTALEALSHGCASVSTDEPPMPEIFSNAARYYRAGDSDALAVQLRAVLSGGPMQRSASSSAALARARQFSWEHTARDTVSELLQAAGAQVGARLRAASASAIDRRKSA